jgi:prepilin-type N-terminal cleavage/methylation domain-containing protein
MAIQMPVVNARGTNMQQQEGFSLIELLIVVAIILIIAAIAIPSLIRAKIAANESSAAASVRTVSTAQIAYAASYPLVGYAADIATLGPGGSTCIGPTSTNACLLDNVLSSGLKSGYTFSTVASGGTPKTEFVSASAPSSFNITGVRSFCMVTDGVLRIDPGPKAIAGTVAACQAYPIAQ